MQTSHTGLKLALAALLGLAVGWWVWLRPQAPAPSQTVNDLPMLPAGTASAQAADPEPAGDPKNSSSDEQNNIDIYRIVSPAVVNITSTTVQYDFFMQPVPQEGSGSGFLIDDKGHIVTNWHVVSGARAVEVTMSDQTKYPAELVGRDPQTDIAVIKINAKKPLTFVNLAGPDLHLRVGQKVLAIGNPFGLDGTLTTGIISSLNRTIRGDRDQVLEDVIQTDAAINPGNSGGPLLNSRGEVIGINTAIFGQANIGIGFAIPINSVRGTINELLTSGRVRRAWLGVVGQEITAGLARALGLPVDKGLLIAQVNRNGAAFQAGIKPGTELGYWGNQQVVIGGDLIVGIDGSEINSNTDLNRLLARKRPGDSIKITLYRDGRRLTMDVVLKERPDTGA
jgi:S1-C subfamily serine protease